MNPKITVALPLYNMGKIVELALHGLSNQSTAYDWELLICEETFGDYYGYDKFMSWKKELEKNGCVRLHYIPLKEWVPLGQKWRMLAQAASDSTCFILQAGDCLSHSKRLQSTYDAFKNHKCNYYDEQKGYFYSYELNKTIIFNPDSTYKHECRLNMAWSTSLMKKLQNNGRRRIVDSFLFSELSKKEKIIKFRNQELHEDGFDADGYNNISSRSKFFKQESHIFQFTDVDLAKRNPILNKFKGLEITKNKIK
jgi:hypothetical protein